MYKWILETLVVNCFFGSMVLMPIVIAEAILGINFKKPYYERYKYVDPWKESLDIK